MKTTDYRPTITERFLLQYIKSYSNNNRTVFQNNKKLAELIDVSEPTISCMISRLIANGYIKRTKVDGIRHLTYTGKKFTEIPFFIDFKKIDVFMLRKRVTELESENALLKIEVSELKNKLNSTDQH